MTTDTAALVFMALLVGNGAELSPRDPEWLDYSEPKNVFTRGMSERIRDQLSA